MAAIDAAALDAAVEALREAHVLGCGCCASGGQDMHPDGTDCPDWGYGCKVPGCDYWPWERVIAATVIRAITEAGDEQ